MATILLIGDNEQFNTEIRGYLDHRQHIVEECRSLSNVMDAIRDGTFAFQLVVLDMSLNRSKDWDVFNQLQGLIRSTGNVAKLVCLSATYWGPKMQLDVERSGGRLVYIQ